MHWQNLTDDQKIGHPTGSIMRHGRAWLHAGQKTIRWEWAFLLWTFNIGVSVNRHEEDLCFHFGLPGFSFHLGLEGFFPRKWKTWDLGRSCGVRIHSGALWVDVWRDENGWSRDMPWYAKGRHFDPVDFLLGRSKYSERTLDGRNATISMPEADYPVTIRLYEASWKRPRWPFPRRIIKAEVKSEKGVPVPGKGENSWDCGEDAIFSSTFPCGGFEEAAAEFARGALSTRGKYGGLNWRPAEADSKSL
jgi:hypothetical protein